MLFLAYDYSFSYSSHNYSHSRTAIELCRCHPSPTVCCTITQPKTKSWISWYKLSFFLWLYFFSGSSRRCDLIDLESTVQEHELHVQLFLPEFLLSVIHGYSKATSKFVSWYFPLVTIQLLITLIRTSISLLHHGLRQVVWRFNVLPLLIPKTPSSIWWPRILRTLRIGLKTTINNHLDIMGARYVKELTL